MAPDYLFFRLDRADRRIGGWTPILVAEKYEAHEGHELHTPNIHALLAVIANRGSRISVADVNRSLNSTQLEDGELFLFLIVVAGCAGKLFVLRDFNVCETDLACDTFLQVTFGHQLLQFQHESGIVQYVT